jgi:hypothetical protein
MKKIIMMAVAAFMATVSANAQFEKGTWSLQPILGVGASTITNAANLNLSGNKELDKRATSAYLIGVEGEYQFADKFSVAAGVNYTSQGCGWDDYNDGINKLKDLRADLGYIKIPIVANYYIFKGFAVKAGIQFGVMASSKIKLHQEGKMNIFGEARDADIDYSVDIKNQFQKFDFSIPIGVSYQFKVPIVIDARYQIGLTKLNKETAPGAKNLKNSVLMLTVGYKFAL